MNADHLHLVLNHAPLFGVLFGVIALAFALVRRSDDVVRLGLGLILIAGLFVVPTYFSGEEAEDVVEAVAGVSHARIEAHEDAGKLATIGTGALGLLALGALGLFWRRPVPRPLVLGTLALSLAVAAGIGYTANLGGQIRHPEITGSSPAASGDAYSDDARSDDRRSDEHDD